MTINIPTLRASIERHLAERVNRSETRSVGAHTYRITGGRVRVQVRADRLLHVVVSFTASRSSRGLTVRDIEVDYEAALTAETIRYLLGIGIGADFSVATVAFSGAVLTDGEERAASPDLTPFWLETA
jgi:hypothetical protein